ncbi:hypothetical protein LCGC14_2367620, partial [marine sediment metagenome]
LSILSIVLPLDDPDWEVKFPP